MRFFHLADLHLGKVLNDVSFLEDQAYILNEILSLCDVHQPRAVLIAGDVYQRSSPQAEAVALFDSFLTRLVKKGLKVFVIAGNHDQRDRVAYLSGLLPEQGVFLGGGQEGAVRTVTLRDEFGALHVHLMDYVRLHAVRRQYPEAGLKTPDDAVRQVLSTAPLALEGRHVLVAHQFILGGQISDSEEHQIGGSDAVDARLFDAFDYVALGHLHGPQRVLRDTVRYAGSPLKYSFSEVNHQKGVLMVDVLGKGRVDIQKLPLKPLRDVSVVRGKTEELLKRPLDENYCWVQAEDEAVHPDARLMLRSVFPNMLRFSVENGKQAAGTWEENDAAVEKQDVLSLFSSFYQLQNGDALPSEEHKKIFRDIAQKLGGVNDEN